MDPWIVIVSAEDLRIPNSENYHGLFIYSGRCDERDSEEGAGEIPAPIPVRLQIMAHPNFGSEHSIFSSGIPSSDSESMLVLDADEFWHLSGDNLETRKRLGYFPVKFALQLYGCCDGIVCVGFRPSYLYLTPKETYFLWNPATSEYKK